MYLNFWTRTKKNIILNSYQVLWQMLEKNEASLNFACDLQSLNQHEDFLETFADPEGLV